MPLPAKPKTATPLSRGDNDYSLWAVGLLAVLTVAGAMALLPNTEQKASALLASGRYSEAVGLLAKVDELRGLDRHEMRLVSELYPLWQQQRQTPVVPLAQLDLTAEDLWIMQQMVVQHRQTRDFWKEAALLRPLFEKAPTLERLNRLQALYRLNGDVAKEQSLLVLAAAAGLATNAQLTRLTTLSSTTGHERALHSAIWTSPDGRFSAALADSGQQ